MCEYSAKKQEPDLVFNDYDLMNYKPDLVISSTVDPLSHTAIFKLEIDLIPDVSEVV